MLNDMTSPKLIKMETPGNISQERKEAKKSPLRKKIMYMYMFEKDQPRVNTMSFKM